MLEKEGEKYNIIKGEGTVILKVRPNGKEIMGEVLKDLGEVKGRMLGRGRKEVMPGRVGCV